MLFAHSTMKWMVLEAMVWHFRGRVALEWQTLPSTRSRDDKRGRVLAWRVKLGSELHLLFTADDKHIQNDLCFSPGLEKLLLMIAHYNNPQNSEYRVLTDTQNRTRCALQHTHTPSCSFSLSGEASDNWRGVCLKTTRLAHLITTATITVLFQAYLWLGMCVVELIIWASSVNLSVT